MSTMTHMQRMHAVLSGEKPDQAPVSFWCHFDPSSTHGQPAVDAHLRHLSRFDLDFLKVMNDNPYPSPGDVRTVADLHDLPVLNGDEEGFGLQLELLGNLKTELSGRVLLSTTLFNPWTVLRRLVRRTKVVGHNPPVLHGRSDPVDVRVSEFLAEDRNAVAAGLSAIAASLANFAKRCLSAGADGVFLSVREDWVNTDANGQGTYEELVRPGDLQILAAAADGRLNMLHVCGVPRDLDAFAAYPIHVLNWADRAAGPVISAVIDRISPVVCGGVDNLSTLPDGTSEAVKDEVQDALCQAGDRPMIVSAGCTYAPDRVPEANLAAMVEAARMGRTDSGV